MRQLDIKTGYTCNNNCVFCLNRNKKSYGEYPLEALTGQIDKSARKGCRYLIISGGEPLISPNFLKILNSARDSGIKVIEIQTNARMLCYAEFLAEILKVQPVEYRFLVSLHFPDKKLQKKYCRDDGFEQVICGIKNLLKNKLSVRINTVIMKQNLGLLGEVTSILKGIGAGSQQFRMIDGDNLGERFHGFVPRMSEAAAKVNKIIRENGNKFEIAVHEFPVCILGREMRKYLTVPPNPQRENFAIGNKVFMSDQIAKYQFVFSGGCRDCPDRPVCSGIRKGYASHYGFSELRPEKNAKNN
jgi:MoaA/NifB/PqqE/SkfB family radical SAM enzyme